MSTAIATQSEHQDYAAIVERVLATGDLAKLSSAERINYYNAVCRIRRTQPAYAAVPVHHPERKADALRAP